MTDVPAQVPTVVNGDEYHRGSDPVLAAVEPDPGRPYAAYVAGFLTVAAFVLGGWITDETPKKHPSYTQEEFKDDIMAGLAASGLVGLGTFATKKPLRRKV